MTRDDALVGVSVGSGGQEAYDTLLIAADEGDAEALAVLGGAHYVGVGADIDGDKARLFLAEGAALGSALAAHNLGTLYATGVDAVRPNMTKARFFWALAQRLDARLGIEARRVRGEDSGRPEGGEKK